MHFEGRDLKLYAEPVSVNELQEGAVYFLVDFVDNETCIPRLQPFVHIGRDLARGDVGRLYFQDAFSYWQGVRFGAAGDDADEAEFIQTAEARARPVYEYERALEILMSCSLRRRGLPGAM